MIEIYNSSMQKIGSFNNYNDVYRYISYEENMKLFDDHPEFGKIPWSFIVHSPERIAIVHHNSRKKYDMDILKEAFEKEVSELLPMANPPVPFKRMGCVNVLYLVHQANLISAHRLGLYIKAGQVHAQQKGTAAFAHLREFFSNQCSAFLHRDLPSTLDKKSFSTFNLPIVACNLSSSLSWLDWLGIPLANTCDPWLNRAFFQLNN